MTQRTLGLKRNGRSGKTMPATAEAVGLTSDDSAVTLRFIGQVEWGKSASRQIRLDRKLAEQLSRLLNDELDSYSWDF